jgi:hypothetical protein
LPTRDERELLRGATDCSTPLEAETGLEPATSGIDGVTFAFGKWMKACRHGGEGW